MILINRQSRSCLPVTYTALGTCTTTNISNLLPNPRLVSSTFHTDQDAPQQQLTQLFTIFAQFVDHDLTLASTYQTPDCCALSSPTLCAPITVPNGDPFYPNDKCLNFARSLIFCQQQGCDTDPMNTLTAYLDASQVYGSDDESSNTLREHTGGKLATSGVSLLPMVNGAFKAGDSRALEHPALGSIHTIFVREHNRIAQLIQNKFPSWSDERVFQNTKRIVTAEYENIVLGEMLPLILGDDNIFPAHLTLTPYKNSIDASIVNEFAAAAFRFGHTLLNGNFERSDPASGSLLNSYLLRFNFDIDNLYKEDPDNGMTTIIKGMTAQRAQKFDQFLTKEVTQFLFSKSSDNFLFGEDLVTRNIQRGRDHSIQSWRSYRQWCGLPTPDNWNTVPPQISIEKWNTLRRLYLKVSDIDLFTGGLAEAPIAGGTVGPTFACLIERQFERLVDGDRYLFSHKNNVGSQFTQNQIIALKNVKLSDIICKTTSISQIQQNAFLVPSPVGGLNPLVSCSNAYNLDIDAFFGNFIVESIFCCSIAFNFNNYKSIIFTSNFIVIFSF